LEIESMAYRFREVVEIIEWKLSLDGELGGPKS
jgi:hypothetical protein